MSFVLVQDTREQKGWSAPNGVGMVRATLPHADYSVLGFEHRCAIERKSLDDLVGSIFGDWKRFSARLSELALFDFAAIVVECTEKDIREKKYVPDIRSTRRLGTKASFTNKVLDRLEPGKVLAAAAKIHAEFNVPVLFCGSPTRAASYAFSLLKFWHDKHGHGEETTT